VPGTGFGRWSLPEDTSNPVGDDRTRSAIAATEPQATQQVAQLPRTLPSAKDLRVYVIDNFDTRDTSISRSNTSGDMSHGHVVETIIRRGLPDAQITRVSATGTPGNSTAITGDGTAAGSLTNTLETIIAQQTQAQAVPRSQIDLKNFVVNMSLSDKRPLTAGERTRLAAATAEFTARGGRIYVAAGNEVRNAIIDLRGITGVDGSDGVIGGAANRLQSPRFTNGNVPNVANSQFVPFHQANGQIRPFADSSLLLPPGTEGPAPPAPFDGKPLAGVLADQTALAEPLRRHKQLSREIGDIFIRQERGGLSPAETERLGQREKAARDELSTVQAKIDSIAAGKVVPLSIVNPHGEVDSRESGGIEVVPRGIDRNRVYVSSEYLVNGVSGTNVVYYENAGGVLRPLSAPGLGMASWGTSWATPNFLVEQEVARLQRLNARPAQP
jgi:hypothetical protein